jgi:hypothetical protein
MEEEEYSRREIPLEVRKPFLALLKNYKDSKKDLEALDLKRNELVAHLDTIKKAMNVLYRKEHTYNKELGWKEKILWTLNKADRLLPVSMIVSIIKSNETDLEVTIDPIIRLTIKRMVEKNEIIKYESENLSSLHYGLSEWFVNGKLLETYYF